MRDEELDAGKTPIWAGTTPPFPRLRAQTGALGRSSPDLPSIATHSAIHCNSNDHCEAPCA